MKKLNEIAELIVKHYESKYDHFEIVGFLPDAVDVIFYSYWEPEIGYMIQYDTDKNIEIEHFEKIRKDSPVLYREIKNVINERGE